ncbi:MAG: YceD family protein [Chitinophagaceae bacterium]
MGNKREFEIAFVGLKPGIHVFNYDIGDSFFETYGSQDFTNCKAKVKLSLDKNNGFMQLHFDISGVVDVDCDRCGNALTKDLWDEFDMVVKLVEEPDEMNNTEEDPDVFYISRTESHLMVSDWIYEFVNLSVPMQKMCGEDDNGKSLCNQEVIEKLKQMEADVNKVANPLWHGLEKFKDLEN